MLNHNVRARTLQKWFIFMALRALELCVVSIKALQSPEASQEVIPVFPL